MLLLRTPSTWGVAMRGYTPARQWPPGPGHPTSYARDNSRDASGVTWSDVRGDAIRVSDQWLRCCGWMQHGRYKMWSNFSQPSATIRGGHSVGITISAQCQCSPADTMRDLIHAEHLDGVTLINIFSWLLKWLRKINCKLFIGLAMAMTLHDFVIILLNFAPPY